MCNGINKYLGVADIDCSGTLSISDVTALLDVLSTAV